MNKKIVIALFICALPIFAMAQQKIGHVNSADVMQAMPERTTIEKSLGDLQTEWENQLLKMREEYSKKVAEYQKDEVKWSQAIKEAKQSELADMESRMSTLVQTAQTDIQKKQQELMQPIIEKVKKAIEQVGADNGYTYIVDESTQVLVFIAPNAPNVTALVKQKLGI